MADPVASPARIAAALEQPRHSWVTLSTGLVLPREFAEATARFDAGPYAAAREAEAWLAAESAHPLSSSRTHVCLGHGMVLGFYSLASGEVALTRRDREATGSRFRRTPASLVGWIAKDASAPIDGHELLLHAVGTARRVAEIQGTSVIAIDAFDDALAQMWRERFGFRDAAPPLAGEPHRDRARLWIPLD
jgi:hypothetical protein